MIYCIIVCNSLERAEDLQQMAEEISTGCGGYLVRFRVPGQIIPEGWTPVLLDSFQIFQLQDQLEDETCIFTEDYFPE